jgi:hypothetical protein
MRRRPAQAHAVLPERRGDTRRLEEQLSRPVDRVL